MPVNRRNTLPTVLATLLLAACAPSAPSLAPMPVGAVRAALAQVVDSLVGAPQFRNAHWGILIVDPAAGDTLYSRNAGKLFMPASNQKILTGAVALAQLGPDYRFTTDFAVLPADPANPGVRGGVLDGDLVVTGSGDPTVSAHARGDAMAPLRAAADSLRARGITRITGRLMAGADRLPGPPLGWGWAWDDVDFPYSAGVDELFFNEGFSRVTVYGGAAPGDAVRARTEPAAGFPTVDVEATTAVAATGDAAPRARIAHALLGEDVVVSGTVAIGDSTTLRITHRDPATAYLAVLREALSSRGVSVEGPWSATPDSAATRAATPLFTMHSLPLREIMPLLQKPSQNQIAELLYRVLGLEVTGVGSADSGRRVIERQLVAWGAEEEGFVVRDGSGLSRHNYVTPETIVRVLAAAQQDTAFGVFYHALPIAGVDGTIANRMKETPAAGNLRAKTGYIDRARSLSGYVTTADGRLLIFSALANNWTTSVRDVERVQDAIGAYLAQMTLGGQPAQ